ncbi:13925_t:CDS:2 [Gigaspora margarita]|uniref:13925_t:CDS:1 n=1 Tax=Gigaspora margarita TaxID=4874 RepID=A0ABN7UN27_GIGMA|nr:13925_t:CDS:2 [Gigaspora margarita]
MSRYSRDHWFSVVVLTIIDAVKIILSFTMKDHTINSCITNPIDIDERSFCENKADFDIKAGLVVFGAQEIILIALGFLTWYCVKRVSQKPTNQKKRKSEKKKNPKDIDMEVQEPHVANDVTSIVSTDILEKRQNMDENSLIANPPSPFFRRPTLNQRQENQIPDGIKQEYNNINPNNSRIQENQGNQGNQGNSNITNITQQNSQRFDQIYTVPTHKPGVPIQQIQGSQGLPIRLPSTSYNNLPNSRPPIVHRHNSVLPSQRLAGYQPMPQYIPDMRPVNGNGMMFSPNINQTGSISGYRQSQRPQQRPQLPQQPYDKVPYSRGHKRSDSYPQPRPLPLPPVINYSETYQVPQQSTFQGNTRYKFDQRSTFQSNEPFSHPNFSKSLPNLHDSNIIEPPIPQLPSSNNNISSQPKAYNTSFKSFEASNIIPNSNNTNNDSLKRMRRKSAHSVRGEATPRPDYTLLYNHYNDLPSTSRGKYNDHQITNDYYVNNSYVAHSRLTNQVFPYGGGKNINKQHFNQTVNNGYTNNSYAVA